MKVKFLPQAIAGCLFFLMIFCSCKKSDSNNNTNTGNNLAGLTGSWQTTVWGGANDTARMNIISSGTGTLTYLNAGAMTTMFSVNDVIYSNIVSTGTNTYSATAHYRYTATGGTPNGTTATTTTTFALQNSGTTLYVHPAADAGTGVTPPEYYWYKQ